MCPGGGDLRGVLQDGQELPWGEEVRTEAVLGRGPACATSRAMQEPRSRGGQDGLERDGWCFTRHRGRAVVGHPSSSNKPAPALRTVFQRPAQPGRRGMV